MILFKALFVGYGKFDKSIIISTFVLMASINNSLADGFSALFVFMICTYIFKPKYFNNYMNPKYIDTGFVSSRIDYKKRILRIIQKGFFS